MVRDDPNDRVVRRIVHRERTDLALTPVERVDKVVQLPDLVGQKHAELRHNRWGVSLRCFKT